MKKIKTEMVEVERVVSSECFCDLCGGDIKNIGPDEKTQKIVFKTGYGFPESGHFDYEEAYFCTSCGEKVKAILEDLGVIFTHRERDW